MTAVSGRENKPENFTFRESRLNQRPTEVDYPLEDSLSTESIQKLEGDEPYINGHKSFNAAAKVKQIIDHNPYGTTSS